MPVLSLAPEDRMQAVLLIDQNTRNDLAVGQPVLLQCHSWVGRYWSSEIREIGERDTDQPPAALAGNGSGVTVVTDARGRQKMVSAAYRGIVRCPRRQRSNRCWGPPGKPGSLYPIEPPRGGHGDWPARHFVPSVRPRENRNRSN
ncbi:MAG: hypothetical protein R3C12_15155 [Planctomycetaceae bacterium]